MFLDAELGAANSRCAEMVSAETHAAAALRRCERLQSLLPRAPNFRLAEKGLDEGRARRRCFGQISNCRKLREHQALQGGRPGSVVPDVNEQSPLRGQANHGDLERPTIAPALRPRKALPSPPPGDKVTF
jgi:hypothetical protein